MTAKSLEVLSKNDNGFFLMVEGSKVDWAAHANDPVGLISEFLAFDRAVEVAIEFAKNNGETMVVVVPDHGNSGISIGHYNLPRYDKASLEEIIGPFRDFKLTAEGLGIILNDNPVDSIRPMFKRYMNIDLSEKEYESVLAAANYKPSDLPKDKRSWMNLQYTIAKIITSRTYIGFTTHGHTGEDVFLAVYHPRNGQPQGMLTGVELNSYVKKQMGLDENSLDELTDRIFAPHQDVFAGADYRIENLGGLDATLIVNGSIRIPAYMNKIFVDGRLIEIESTAIYSSANETFYIPRELAKLIE